MIIKYNRENFRINKALNKVLMSKQIILRVFECVLQHLKISSLFIFQVITLSFIYNLKIFQLVRQSLNFLGIQQCF